MKCLLFSAFWLLSLTSLTAQVKDFKATNFKAADSVAALYDGHSLQNLPVLSYNLTSPFAEDVNKLRAIYTWVSTNIENEYTFYALNKRKREKLNDDPVGLKEWNEQFTDRVFDKLRKENKTVCTGYAYLIKELCYHAGIEAEIIDGYGRTAEANIGGEGLVNHSWNSVKLNDKWYLCDATWSSGGIDAEEKRFIKSYNDGYFLADPEVFVLNHYPMDTSWALLNEKPALEQFLNGPLVYKGAFSRKINPISPEEFKISQRKGEDFSIQLQKSDTGSIGEIVLEIIRGNTANNDIVIPEHMPDDQYQINYTFKRKGDYVVHVQVEGEYVVSYEVGVK